MENKELEQIDLLMQRANVTYQEAKDALDAHQGDVVEALLDLEKNQKIKAKKCVCDKEKAKSFIQQLNKTTFIMKKKEREFVNVPLSIAIVAVILCCHVSIVAAVIALIFGVRFQIKNANECTVNFAKEDFVK